MSAVAESTTTTVVRTGRMRRARFLRSPQGVIGLGLLAFVLAVALIPALAALALALALPPALALALAVALPLPLVLAVALTLVLAVAAVIELVARPVSRAVGSRVNP